MFQNVTPRLGHGELLVTAFLVADDSDGTICGLPQRNRISRSECYSQKGGRVPVPACEVAAAELSKTKELKGKRERDGLSNHRTTEQLIISWGEAKCGNSKRGEAKCGNSKLRR